MGYLTLFPIPQCNSLPQTTTSTWYFEALLFTLTIISLHSLNIQCMSRRVVQWNEFWFFDNSNWGGNFSCRLINKWYRISLGCCNYGKWHISSERVVAGEPANTNGTPETRLVKPENCYSSMWAARLNWNHSATETRMHFSQSGQNLLFTYIVQCTFNLGFGIGRAVTKEVNFCMPINVGHIYFTYPIS